MKRVWFLVVMSTLPVACVSTATRTRESIELAEPRVSSGLIVPDGQEERLAQAVAAYESRRRSQYASDHANAASRVDAAHATDYADAAGSARALRHPPDRGSPSVSRESTPPAPALAATLPPASGRLIPAGKLSVIELEEVVDALVLKIQTERGYAVADASVGDSLPPVPAGVARGDLLARSVDDTLRLIRIGYRHYVSQPSQLWVQGVVVHDNALTANDDLDALEPAVEAVLQSIERLRGNVTPAELEAEVIQLSFVDARSALAALTRLGVTTVSGEETMPTSAAFEKLPLVMAMPAPNDTSMSLVGGEQKTTRDERGMFAIPTVASQLGSETVAGPASQLLVLFHPAHPEQHSRILGLLGGLIDVPARQVFIEGMVIEISEDGLDELGIEWEFQTGSAQGTFGAAVAGLSTQTLGFLNDESLDLNGNWSVRLRALVRDNKAQILSRPSVITLDNRQATIRIGTDIPVATSQEGFGVGANKIAFDFRYLPTGILLNVRPRIDASNNEISMQVDTTVSATVPGADLEVRSESGTILATAPTISSRRVQTYARVANNRPFIIGGLVSHQTTTIQDKIPLLGDLPLVGSLFRAERDQTSRREVIIVLTPYVLPERRRIDRVTPKSEDVFDSFGNELFRDAYRLREQEVFDLSFLTENRRLLAYKTLANTVIRRNFRLASTEPFSLFAGDRIPGEHILVERMMYEIVKRLDCDRKVNDRRIIYFVEDKHAGYRVRFLEELLAGLADQPTMDAFFAQPRTTALYITFTYGRESMLPDAFRTEPVPDIGLIDCNSRDRWEELLWNMNQPDDRGRTRYTILIQNRADLQRLRRAIVLNRIVQLNGQEANLTLRHFGVGTMVQMPDLLDDEIHVIDAAVARYFFHTEHYYPAATQRIEQAIDALDRALRRPEIRSYLEGATLPPGR